MLVYLFWHRPSGDADGAIGPAGGQYQRAVAAFHASLADDPPAGFHRSWCVALSGPPWWGSGLPCYLDAYVVADWSALGVLNSAAVGGRRGPSHDAAAALAADGTGGLLAVRRDGRHVTPSVVAFATRPAGRSYGDYGADLLAAAPAGTAVWQRQLTLGPGPEFVLASGAPLARLPGEAMRLAAVPVW